MKHRWTRGSERSDKRDKLTTVNALQRWREKEER